MKKLLAVLAVVGVFALDRCRSSVGKPQHTVSRCRRTCTALTA